MEYVSFKKQLMAKQIEFQSPYPAKLKVFVRGETLLFHSAWEAADGLRDLGIDAVLSEQERLERDLHCVGWTSDNVKDNKRAEVNRNLFGVMEGFLNGLGETVSTVDQV